MRRRSRTTRRLRRLPLAGGQFLQIFHLRSDAAVETSHLRIGRFDDQVFVGCVRAVAVSEAEMPSGQIERLARKDVPGPRSSEPGPEYRLDSVPAIDGGLCPYQSRLLRSGGGVVTAGHIHF